jgi:hypothetical protein
LPFKGIAGKGMTLSVPPSFLRPKMSDSFAM